MFTNVNKNTEKLIFKMFFRYLNTFTNIQVFIL